MLCLVRQEVTLVFSTSNHCSPEIVDRCVWYVQHFGEVVFGGGGCPTCGSELVMLCLIGVFGAHAVNSGTILTKPIP